MENIKYYIRYNNDKLWQTNIFPNYIIKIIYINIIIEY